MTHHSFNTAIKCGTGRFRIFAVNLRVGFDKVNIKATAVFTAQDALQNFGGIDEQGRSKDAEAAGKELDKAHTLNASDWRGLNRNQNQNAVVTDDSGDFHWRKLTPLECERLQTVPDNYTNHVSNNQRYKMLGNGWTVEVIKHILQNMKYENDSKS